MKLLTSKTAAMKKAINESSLYRENGVWRLGFYSPSLNVNSNETVYNLPRGRRELRNWRVLTTLIILGYDPRVAKKATTFAATHGSLRECVNEAIEYLDRRGH